MRSLPDCVRGCGWNPLDEHANARLKKELIGTNLNEALILFESHHKAKGTRPNTSQLLIPLLSIMAEIEK